MQPSAALDRVSGQAFDAVSSRGYVWRETSFIPVWEREKVRALRARKVPPTATNRTGPKRKKKNAELEPQEKVFRECREGRKGPADARR